MRRLLALAALLVLVVAALFVVKGRERREESVASAADLHAEAPVGSEQALAGPPVVPADEPAREETTTSATAALEPRAEVPVEPTPRPRASATLAGRVVRPDGAPVAGAEVHLESDGPWRSQLAPLASTQTLRDGSFEFETAFKGPFRLQAIDAETRENKEAGADAVLEHVLPVRLDLVLVLPGPSVLRGIIVDDVGVAVPDFQLECWRADVDASNPRPPSRRRIQDPSGAFELDNLAPGEWSLRFRRKREDPWTTTSATLPLTEPLVLVLPRPAIVHGIVVDPSERPVAGASIEWPQLGRSGKDGSFVLRLAPANEVRLYTTHAGYAPSDVSSFALQPGQELDCALRLRALARVTGEAIGLDGRPLAGRKVSAYHPAEFGLSSLDVQESNGKTVTDAEGRFALDVAPGQVDVEVELNPEERGELELQRGAPGSAGRSCTRSVTLGPGETAEVRLVLGGRPVRVHGRVTLGGKPAEELDVRVGGFGSWDEHRVARGNGTYEVWLPCPGHHMLSMYLVGQLCSACEVEVPDAADFQFDVSLGLGHLSGRITDAGGTPVAGMTVDAERGRVHANTSNRVTTDASGKYSMDLVPGFYRISPRVDVETERAFVDAQGQLVTVEDGGARTGIDFVLHETGAIDGVVRAPDGSAALHAQVRALRPDGNWAQDDFAVDGGRFHLALPDGTYWVDAHTIASDLIAVTAESQIVQLARDAQAFVELQLVPAVLVRVRTVDASGKAKDCFLESLDECGRAGRRLWAKDGVCGLVLVPGHYTLRAQVGGRLCERPVEIDASSTELEVEFRLE